MKPGTIISISALAHGFKVTWADDETDHETVAGCTTMECVFAFIRSRMEPKPYDVRTIRATVGTLTKAEVEIVEPKGAA